ncbi:NADH-quinone oxidoreductase subunit L [Microbispora sp. GKU 823]|uniref:NADH-quinone oxidoreductase subunit 5 family protein n=1 Tax=Microbispora sp. GKU 823 TaxID=1652100 RepID=UPI002118066E|nr:NADH-quinone oxidoreductase subunit L [Microbispora sp. GKU 823]
MTAVVALIVLLPFAAAVAGLLATRLRTRDLGARTERMAYRRAAWFAIAPGAASAALTVWLAVALARGARVSEGRFWSELLPGRVEGTLTVVETGSVPISLTLRADGLSVLAGILVVVVALAVQVYSVGYMRDEPRYPSYSAFVSLFTSAMLLVVYAGDLIVLYVGWEIMGLCSYLLIGHWWEDRANSRAAVKAFLVTRLGDVGFLFGIFVLGTAAGGFRIDDVLRADIPRGTLVAATLLLLAGVAGKSAQVPLQTWLPDAMAGPTPISALIHAATMVAAGIFVVARLYPAFLAAPPTLDVLGVVAAVGMLGAALAALAQDDLKRVLAYSTISQLAYMAAALAAGSDRAAMFHLVSHGAFKALLFLCAGLVIHHVGSNLISHMGGLRTALPVTFWTMTIGFAALAGLPPASGFFSKDAVISAIEHGTGPAQPFVYASALLTVGVTGAYAARAWLRTFFGPARIEPLPEPPPGVAHVFDGREAPPSMLWPAGVAGRARPAARPRGSGGRCGGRVGVRGRQPRRRAARRRDRVRPVAGRARAGPRPAARPVPGAVRAGLPRRRRVRGAGRPARPAPGQGVVRADARVVDGAVRGSGRATLGLSGLVRLAQNGNAQLYVTGLLAGLVLIAVAAVVLT